MQNLKNGFKLIQLDIPDNKEQYSHLYYNDKQLSNKVFRMGGMCNGFKDGYCQLIHYKFTNVYDVTNGTEVPEFDFGTHVIVNSNGDIVLSSKNRLVYPYHCGGVVAHVGDTYVNLLTGEEIVIGDKTMKTDNYLFVQNSYNKDYELGVYQIELATGNYTLHQ